MDYHLLLCHFLSTDNLLLPGLLYESKEKTEKVVIFLHGNGSSSIFYGQDTNIMGEELTKNGIAYFPFNNRGAHIIKKLNRIVSEEKERVNMGMAYELIKDCTKDIDGAIAFLKKKGYTTFYLMGESTGANKIVLYHYYQRKNPVSKYILLSGGDDTGLYYEQMGRKKFLLALEKSRKIIKRDPPSLNLRRAQKIAPKYLSSDGLSYQSLYDTINPDGDYNIFPFNEYMNNLKLSKKPLFKEYKTIDKPTLVIYGEFDEYCYGDVPRCMDILKKECGHPEKFTFQIIKNTDHGFSKKEQELAEVIIKWLVV